MAWGLCHESIEMLEVSNSRILDKTREDLPNALIMLCELFILPWQNKVKILGL
jgi:hypothetical protein